LTSAASRGYRGKRRRRRRRRRKRGFEVGIISIFGGGNGKYREGGMKNK